MVWLSSLKTPWTASCSNYIKPSSRQGVCLPVNSEHFNWYQPVTKRFQPNICLFLWRIAVILRIPKALSRWRFKHGENNKQMKERTAIFHKLKDAWSFYRRTSQSSRSVQKISCLEGEGKSLRLHHAKMCVCVCVCLHSRWQIALLQYISYSAIEFQWQDLLQVHWPPNNQVSCLITAMILLKSFKALFSQFGAGKLVQQGACGHQCGVDISKWWKKSSWAQPWIRKVENHPVLAYQPSFWETAPNAMCQNVDLCLFLLRSIGLCTEPGWKPDEGTRGLINQYLPPGFPQSGPQCVVAA